jgi:hypothetical protein
MDNSTECPVIRYINFRINNFPRFLQYSFSLLQVTEWLAEDEFNAISDE